DTDGNGTGDACNGGEDGDGDEWAVGLDNCPATANADQADLDEDGLGDVCDACASDAANDADVDGVCGDIDNCPATVNPGQGDTDGNGTGDACNGGEDRDGDEWADGLDNCLVTINADQADLDEDGLGDVCDADGDGDGFSDEEEIAAGTDPRDPTVFPAPEPSAVLLGGSMLLCLLALRRRGLSAAFRH
ncbi:MAG: thrombospondin type 3 repeat-containing protein, partial [Myxococcota bacterium]